MLNLRITPKFYFENFGYTFVNICYIIFPQKNCGAGRRQWAPVGAFGGFGQ